LVALHGDWVPVVTVDGKVRFRGGVTRTCWSGCCEAEAKRLALGR